MGLLPWPAKDPEGFSVAAATCQSNLGNQEIYTYVYNWTTSYKIYMVHDDEMHKCVSTICKCL